MILVTGATGFVGHKLMEMCQNTVACPSLRGATEEDIRRIVEECGADTIVHTAAISDMGMCEADPEASYYANVQIPIFLARAAKHKKLICFSSDQVYNGMEREDEPYSEDAVKPINVYAKHKWEMEQRVLEIAPDAVMLRAEWMYDHYDKRQNYFMNVIRAKDTIRFSSQHYRGITYVKEVAENMEKAIRLPGGSYNFGSEVTKSMHQITCEFVAALGKDIRVEDAPKRHNLWLNCDKAKRLGIAFSDVDKALIQCAKDCNVLP